jgi:Cu(I)/Ag(I) efflux system protein CusF
MNGLRRIMKRISLTVLAVGALAAPSAHADSHQTPQPPQAAATAAAATMAEGEVRKVDKDAGKITLRHGEIKSLEMPPMTMVFQVKDKTMLDQVKAGDKVRFSVDKVGGVLTITAIAPAK